MQSVTLNHERTARGRKGRTPRFWGLCDPQFRLHLIRWVRLSSFDGGLSCLDPPRYTGHERKQSDPSAVTFSLSERNYYEKNSIYRSGYSPHHTL